MSYKRFICIAVIIIAEYIEARKPSTRKEVPHQGAIYHSSSKPAVRSSATFGKTLNSQRQGQDYIEQYQDMMKVSQESFEGFDDRDDKRLRRLIGDDDLGLMAEAGGFGRRGRSGGHLGDTSAVGRRRARTQALRRDKLTAQGASSHKRHSRAHHIQNDNNGPYSL